MGSGRSCPIPSIFLTQGNLGTEGVFRAEAVWSVTGSVGSQAKPRRSFWILPEPSESQLSPLLAWGTHSTWQGRATPQQLHPGIPEGKGTGWHAAHTLCSLNPRKHMRTQAPTQAIEVPAPGFSLLLSRNPLPRPKPGRPGMSLAGLDLSVPACRAH